MTSEKRYWEVKLTNPARKSLKRIDRQAALEILDFLDELATIKDIRSKGKKLEDTTEELYRFKKGNYRVVTSITDDIITVTVTRIGHRQGVYKNLR